ncbi:branched-chain alpha-ketoacid dehydrogenase, partial [Thamnocephalis sphaerospora]
ILERYAERPAQPVTLRQLVVFGRTLDENRLIRSANYVRTELPVRLAHRIRDFQRLPYIVGVNRHIATAYGLYWRAFDAFRRMPVINNMEENREFCRLVEEQIREHLVVIPQLAMGVRECRSYFAAGEADTFMNAALRSRVSRRVLAEQHLALTRQFEEECSAGESLGNSRYIGLIDSRCCAGHLVARCVRTAAQLTRRELHPQGSNDPTPAVMVPRVIVDGHLATTFACIPDHVEYALHELLRNSMRATILHHRDQASGSNSGPVPLPPIRVTVAEGPADLIFRVSDQGGGIRGDCAQLWHFGREGFRAFENVHQLAGKVGEEAALPGVRLGIGLLMARVYAEYWGGGLDLQSMPGWGVDAHLRVSKLGNRVENLAS